MSIKTVVEQAIANAFLAGAECHAIHQGEDSAHVGRHLRRLEADHRYQQSLHRQQQLATEAVGRAIMRVTLAPEKKQGSLF